MLNENIKSPFMEFDYNKLRNDTTIPAIKEIYKTMAENVDLLVYNETATNDSIKDNLADMSFKVLQVLIGKKVPDSDMQFIITLMQESLSVVFAGIAKQKYEYEKELLARTIGTRDPGTGKLSREFVTAGDLFAALEKVRVEQDKEENQYFIQK